MRRLDRPPRMAQTASDEKIDDYRRRLSRSDRPRLRCIAAWHAGAGVHHPGHARRQTVHVLARRCAQNRTRGAVLLSCGVHAGCTVEAHEFAEATAKFKALGATVIGVSHDPIDTLNRFSVTECRNKFAVASDADQKIMKSYDAVLGMKPEYADRTSYVIAPAARSLRVHRDESRQARRKYAGRRREVVGAKQALSRRTSLEPPHRS